MELVGKLEERSSRLLFFRAKFLVFPSPILKAVCYAQSNSLQPHGLQPPGISVHGILQARILEWVAMPSSRGSSQPRDRIGASCTAGSSSPVELPGPILKARSLLNTCNGQSYTDYLLSPQCDLKYSHRKIISLTVFSH